MVNYRDNQFARSPFFGGVDYDDGERTNPAFTHTSSEIRTFDVGRSESGLSPFSTRKIQRGFMRNLSTNIGKIGTRGAPQRFRLRFQFNPATIQQNVEARQDMYLSILQDPYQLAQPVAASTSFSFELLFDRTHELMNGGPKADLLQVPGQSPTSASSGDAGDIGVLADLAVMYSVIGQGFTAETLSSQFEIFKQNARREYERAVASGDLLFTLPEYDNEKKIYKERQGDFYGDEGTFDNEKFGNYFKDQLNKIPDFMSAANNVNIGNAAFLVPMPVRIVFSSLYMVDGYVTSTNVVFTKFNTKMVPTQCRVLLNVHAVYIGFARDQTFLSKTVEDTGVEARKQLAADRKELADFCKEYGPNLQKYVVSFGDSASTFLPDVFTGNPRNNPTAYAYAVSGDNTHKIWASVDSELFNTDKNFQPAITTGFAGAGGTTVTKKKGGFTIPVGPGAGIPIGGGNPFNDDYKVSGGVHTYYEDGGTAQINRSATVHVYGPFNSEAEARAAGRNNAYKVGQFNDNRSAGNADNWLSGKTVASRQTGAFSVSGNKTNENAISSPLGVEQFFPGQKNYNDLTSAERKTAYDQALSEYGDKYFAFYADVEVITSVGDQPDATGTAKASSGPLIAQGSTNMQGQSLSVTLPTPCEAVELPDDNPYINPDRIDTNPPGTRIPPTL